MMMMIMWVWKKRNRLHGVVLRSSGVSLTECMIVIDVLLCGLIAFSNYHHQWIIIDNCYCFFWLSFVSHRRWLLPVSTMMMMTPILIQYVSCAGFIIDKYHYTFSVCQCSSISFGSDMMSGEMKSPLHPRSYCDNLDCQYEIEPRPGIWSYIYNRLITKMCQFNDSIAAGIYTHLHILVWIY
jgi:hypothetical protein